MRARLHVCVCVCMCVYVHMQEVAKPIAKCETVQAAKNTVSHVTNHWGSMQLANMLHLTTIAISNLKMQWTG